MLTGGFRDGQHLKFVLRDVAFGFQEASSQKIRKPQDPRKVSVGCCVLGFILRKLSK